MTRPDPRGAPARIRRFTAALLLLASALAAGCGSGPDDAAGDRDGGAPDAGLRASRPIPHQLFDEGGDPRALSLDGVFVDDPGRAPFSLAARSLDESLVRVALEGTSLVVQPAARGRGHVEIEVTATSEGRMASSRFLVSIVGRAPKVFLMAGQSNMVGHGRAADLSLVAPQLLDARDDAFAESTLERSRALGPLGPGYGRDYGPELSFGATLGDALEEHVYLYKAAVGGTTLYAADQWRPPSRGGAAGNLYHQMIDGFRAFFDARVAEGLAPEVAGFVWFQGYNDALDEASTAEYEDNLRALLDDLRADLELPELPVVICQLNDVQGERGARVAAAHAAVAEADGHASWIPTADQRPYYHYGSASYVVIGERAGRAMLAHLHRPTTAPRTLSVHPESELVLGPDEGLMSGTDAQYGAVELVDPPALGELTLETDGALRYRAPTGHRGPDPFRYRVVSGALGGQVATATPWIRDAGDDLVAHFPFDGDSAEAGAAERASGLPTHVARDGIAFGVAGRLGGAARFDGEGALHYVWDYPHPDFLRMDTDHDFTLAAFIRSDADDATERILISNKYYAGRDYGFALTTAAGGGVSLFLGAHDHETYSSARVVVTSEAVDLHDGAWHHVAVSVSFGDGVATLYIDGRAVGAGDVSALEGEIDRFEGAIGDGSGGGDGNSNGFVGDLDDVRIYRRALAPSEIVGLSSLED